MALDGVLSRSSTRRKTDVAQSLLVLKAQAEGQSAKLMRKAKAYASMTSAAYRGQRRGYTFDNYVSVHQEAHNELFDLEVEVPESKKVTDFLKGIQDPQLQVGKQIVLGDPKKMGNFEECQQYLGTLIQNTGIQAKMERNVSSVRSNGGGGGNSNSGEAPEDPSLIRSKVARIQTSSGAN